MKLIDHSDGLRQAFGTRVFKKTWCVMCHCSDPIQLSLGEVLHENQSNIHFDSQELGS